MRINQPDQVRVNSCSPVFPPPDVDSSLMHVYTHRHKLSPLKPAERQESQRTTCCSLGALSSLLRRNYCWICSGLIAPWDSRAGHQSNQNCPPWLAWMWRAPPFAGGNSNQVCFLPYVMCLYFISLFILSLLLLLLGGMLFSGIPCVKVVVPTQKRQMSQVHAHCVLLTKKARICRRSRFCSLFAYF